MDITATMSLLALAGTAASVPVLKWGRRLDEDTLSRIERRCAQVAFPPLLAGAIWFLFTFYPMIRLIVLIIEALGAILLVILGVILLKFYLFPASVGLLVFRLLTPPEIVRLNLLAPRTIPKSVS
jgi:hypothetical protein